MKGQFFRECHPLRLCTRKNWKLGLDPRLPHGLSLISPKGTVFELVGGNRARKFEVKQIKD